jgi:biopolymer transport protein ExbD
MVGGDGGNEFDVQLNLVPLIDILTNILFFLLVGFAAQEMQYTQNAKLRLPSATSNAEMKMSVSLTLSRDELLVEQVRVATILENGINAPMEGDKIVPLYEKLNTVRTARQQQTGGVSVNDDVIFLLADREIPFSVLSPVMKTSAMAGYPNFRFAVVKK